MVSALHGVLLKCDIPSKQYIVSLNEAATGNEKFIIKELDDTHLFVQPSVTDWLKAKIKEFMDANTTYETADHTQVLMANDSTHTPDVRRLLQRFQQAQTRRARIYNSLQEGFKHWLANNASTQDAQYMQFLTQATSAFQDISGEVRSVESSLRSPAQRPDLAGILRSLQHHEADKLRLTLVLQVLRQKHARQQFSWQHKGDHAPISGPSGGSHRCGGNERREPTKAEYDAALAEAIRGLQSAGIGFIQSHSFSALAKCMWLASGACNLQVLHLSTVGIQQLTGRQLFICKFVGINDCLEELRYAEEDLAER